MRFHGGNVVISPLSHAFIFLKTKIIMIADQVAYLDDIDF
jgi:hypothetical protein